ncbi:AEC family transporter [Psychromonas sp. Urea-02u-13]|uniref:AEC family transporter n=1 Tax=Psychromonas sp. Urea-02u-13 TaxID=2058326 RepID=UPI000C3275F3|nr:AEC family transporter [Psychromonas sp. Urea-02u-13]PKG40471.1 transporter [Psychromonas sp. Urea-02u-13]
MFWQSLLFSFSVTGPICILLFLGWFLKRIKLINDAFVDNASKLVFQVTLPALLFLSIVNADQSVEINPLYIAYGLMANLSFFLLTTFSCKLFIKEKQDHGVIIQGGFRANTAIIGLAYVANVYGDAGVALAAVYVASTTILYNILAVICLTSTQSKLGLQGLKDVTRSIAKNPLIIGITLGVLLLILDIKVPTVLLDSGQYFANMTLPLALLCTGATLNLRELGHKGLDAWFASFFKLLLAPTLITGGAYLWGFSRLELGLLFFMTAAPTAAASYVMARSMGGNANLAANIIAITTAGSLITYSLGISILYSLNFFS